MDIDTFSEMEMRAESLVSLLNHFSAGHNDLQKFLSWGVNSHAFYVKPFFL